MGSYCEAEGFYRKELGMGGSRVNPKMVTSDEVFCEKCNIAVQKFNDKKVKRHTMTDRGRLNQSEVEKDIKCPKCGRTGKVSEDYDESDGNYYSNEERRVYSL